MMNKCKKLYWLKDSWFAWLNGEKFPIAFFGDSTIDGNNTTGWVRNEIGVDGTSPNAFSKRLEDKLKQAAGNQVLRIYNAGFSGQIASWALENFRNIFSPESPYGDVKMIGIGFGINDRLVYANQKEYREQFRANIEGIIKGCYEMGVQPFLLTTQATVEPGVSTHYAEPYPMRTSQHICTTANEVKRELALEYGLELLDINAYTEDFLLYSAHSLQSIISDTLHFEDIGHEYEAGLIFSLINPQVIFVDGPCRIDYSNQRVARSVPDNLLTMPAVVSGSFKVYADYEKEDTEDINVMTLYVFNKAKKGLSLTGIKGKQESDTYVRINGETIALNGPETDLGELELGLHKLEAFSGVSKLVDFKGFIIK